MGTQITVAETIRTITKNHLQNGGLLFGQCVTAVGWIGGTVPELAEADGIVELPTSDVAGPGFAVGAALAGRRPIFICRYQGFMWFNAAIIVNYAAKSKEMWNVPCPIFIRAIAMEGGIGPVATGCHHSLIMRMPGIGVAAPMTPNEWRGVWNHFKNNDAPIYCSEHRLSFPKYDELPNIINQNASVTIFAISAARFNAVKACEQLKSKGIIANLIHIVWLSPLDTETLKCACDALKTTQYGIVVDSDYQMGGAAQSIAHSIMILANKPVYVLGLPRKTAGFAPHLDTLTPSSDEITAFITELDVCPSN